MNHKQIKTDWESRGYSFGIFKDPPGQVWADFVHRTDQLVVLAELKASQSNLQLVKKFLFPLMLCTQLGMWVRQIMSGIMDTKNKADNI